MQLGELSNKSEYILRNGGFFRRSITDEYLGGQEHILSTLVQPQPITIRDLTRIGSQPILLSANASTLTMAVRLMSLPMRVAMTLSDQGDLLFCDGSNAFLGAVPPSFVGSLITTPWTPPNGLQLYFFLNMISTGIPGNYACENCYLLAKNLQTGDYLAFYYPNVYDNGRICMGHTWDSTKDRSANDVIGRMVHAYNSFHTTVMNNHLVDNGHIALYKMLIDRKTGTMNWNHPPVGNGACYGRVTSLSFLPNFKNLI